MYFTSLALDLDLSFPAGSSPYTVVDREVFERRRQPDLRQIPGAQTRPQRQCETVIVQDQRAHRRAILPLGVVDRPAARPRLPDVAPIVAYNIAIHALQSARDQLIRQFLD